MKFKATDDQLAQMVANAANASNPVGMGFLHAQTEKVFTKDDFLKDLKTNTGWVNADYVQGRMVKLRFWPDSEAGKGNYNCPDDDPKPDYQSWYHTYPTYKDLLKSVGVEV